ncbi:hypothetical protein O3M35_009736 [Rhynocoris fuscipes]|uniref:ABC transporter domain-containing protein n=1 Tax=Rhynocoris fuscipes TaxID=488301 RepID=A0AAW1D9Y2_9HEMI
MELPNSYEKAVVSVRNAYKTYDGKHYILRGLNMSVKGGTIYGLLGASGCGKSTLLNAIIGLLGLNNGTIDLSITNKRDLGFMPQSICLYEQFTIKELLTYYCTMYGMSKNDIQYRIDLMYKILDLPDCNRSLPNLSGGQKRRVSLAVALIHDPKLLILDEPTVGVDPVLRQRIWDFLVDWCDSGRTIIITTHYIEETKQAHTVALMRQGVMLCEKSPQALLEECNTEYLEDAFLQLSKAQGEGADDIPVVSKQQKYSSLAHTKSTFEFSRFSTEVKKNLIFLWRNIAVASFILLLPTMSIVAFHIAIGDDPRFLKLSVVNDEVTSNIHFCDTQRFNTTKCDLNYLSCNYLKNLKERQYILTDYKYLSEAINEMNRSDTRAVIHIRADFSSAMAQRIEETTLSDDEIVDNSTLQVYIDSSNKLIYESMKRHMRESFVDMVKDVVKNCNNSDVLVKLPIEFKDPIYGHKEPGFRDFAAPAFIMSILFTMPLTYGVVIVIEEKNSGATSRSLVAGTSLFEIFAAHGLVQIGVQMFHTLTCTVLMYGILGYQLQHTLLSASLLMLQGLAGIAFAFTLSVTLDSISAVASIGNGIVYICAIIGGWMWPSEGVHRSIKLLSVITPNTLPAEALRSLTIRGLSFINKHVYMGFVASFTWMVISLIFVYFYVRQRKNKVFLSKKIG